MKKINLVMPLEDFVKKKRLGELSEWFKEHAWKVCGPSKVPWVRIPYSPP